MGKASSTKKVARVARTGGGRTARGRGSWVWPGVLTITVLLGTFLIIYSRDQNQSSASDTPPLRTDHWHAAYGFNICGEWQSDLPQPTTLIGLHTHGDGVIHVEPQGTADTGKNATFGRWVSGQPDLEVDADSLQLPGGKKYENGDDCDGKNAEVRTLVNGEEVIGDPKDIRIRQGQTITIAFVPDDFKLTPPPNAEAKIQIADSGQTEQNKPGEVFATTTAPPNTTTTAATATTTTTAAPAP
jgi:hypothetical protein